MTGATVQELLDELVRTEDGRPCTCGGAVRVGWTPVSYRAVGGGVYETLAHANCGRCGAGRNISIVEERQ